MVANQWSMLQSFFGENLGKFRLPPKLKQQECIVLEVINNLKCFGA